VIPAQCRVGDVFRMVVVDDLKRTQIVQYAGASGDFVPLHTDEVYAREIAGFPGVFAHGMLTMALTGRLVSTLAAPEDLVRFGGRFTAQVWPGDTLTAAATVLALGDGLVDFALTTTNQDGAEVFTGAFAVRG
jgi:acyl dehydratase